MTAPSTNVPLLALAAEAKAAFGRRDGHARAGLSRTVTESVERSSQYLPAQLVECVVKESFLAFLAGAWPPSVSVRSV